MEVGLKKKAIVMSNVKQDLTRLGTDVLDVAHNVFPSEVNILYVQPETRLMLVSWVLETRYWCDYTSRFYQRLRLSDDWRVAVIEVLRGASTVGGIDVLRQINVLRCTALIVKLEQDIEEFPYGYSHSN